MDWWYWFGMWIAGLTSVILTWWASLDAFRRKGSISRFTWPMVALTGIVLQIPAFTVTGEAQASATGTMAAVSGVAGLTVVGIATVAYFSKSSGGGSTWFTRTRDNDSFLSGSRSRRSGAASARASVPVGGGRPASRATRTPTPVEFSGADLRPAVATAPITTATKKAASAAVDDDATVIATDDETVIEDSVADTQAMTTLTEDDSMPESAQATVMDDATVLDEAADATVVDETTVMGDIDTDETVTEDPTFATMIEDDEGPGGRLVITDGRSSRIVITERSGAFVVGRDPARSNLAVDDQKVSRAHFAITVVDSDYVIADLESSNGTFVNGELLREARVLSDGDTIEFGKAIAKFVLDGGE